MHRRRCAQPGCEADRRLTSRGLRPSSGSRALPTRSSRRAPGYHSVTAVLTETSSTLLDSDTTQRTPHAQSRVRSRICLHLSIAGSLVRVQLGEPNAQVSSFVDDPVNIHPHNISPLPQLTGHSAESVVGMTWPEIATVFRRRYGHG
jgi:hypothetical protein